MLNITCLYFSDRNRKWETLWCVSTLLLDHALNLIANAPTQCRVKISR